MKIPAWIRGKAPAPGLSATHRHTTASGQRVVINDEGLTFEEWLGAAGVDSNAIPGRHALDLREAWDKGEDPTEWRARGGKPAKGWKMSNDLEGKNDPRPFYYDVTSDDWDKAAISVIMTINGVGNFHFNSLKEALDSGPYASSKEFVLKHLHWLKDYYEVYEGSKIKNVFQRRFR